VKRQSLARAKNSVWPAAFARWLTAGASGMTSREDATVPDYRQRLAYGTDQGRWLMQQQAAKRPKSQEQNGSGSSPPQTAPAAARRRAPPPRAYHQLDDGVGAVINSPVVRPKTRARSESNRSDAIYCTVAMVGLCALGGLVVVGRLIFSTDVSGDPWIHSDAAGP